MEGIVEARIVPDLSDSPALESAETQKRYRFPGRSPLTSCESHSGSGNSLAHTHSQSAPPCAPSVLTKILYPVTGAPPLLSSGADHLTSTVFVLAFPPKIGASGARGGQRGAMATSVGDCIEGPTELRARTRNLCSVPGCTETVHSRPGPLCAVMYPPPSPSSCSSVYPTTSSPLSNAGGAHVIRIFPSTLLPSTGCAGASGGPANVHSWASGLHSPEPTEFVARTLKV